jgi:F-type H+-transporting ATPase subunit delta
MPSGTVAGVYAQALLELADERSKREQVVASCRWLLGGDGQATVLTSELVAELDDPRLGKDKAKQALSNALAGHCDQEVIDLLRLLIDRNRLTDAANILTEAVRTADTAAGRVVVRIHSAATLSAGAQEAVKGAITRALGASAQIQVQTEPELLGGMTIRVGDIYVDGSVKRQLSDTKARILDVPMRDDLWTKDDSSRSPA